jgi:concanavalin A-like lectin/glucanase superfamily protein
MIYGNHTFYDLTMLRNIETNIRIKMMKTYFLKYLVAFFICLTSIASLVNNRLNAAEPDWIFDWQVFDDTTIEGVTPVPHAEYYSNDWRALYDTQSSSNNIIALMLRNPTGPYDGTTSGALNTVLTYLHDNSYSLNFVFADFESTTEDENCIEMVDQVRAHANSEINSAYIGNYGEYPGAIDYNELWGNFDRTARHNFYINSGMNIAMPPLYPYTAYRNHSERPDVFGTDLCVSIAHALFWAPLERYCTAKRALPSGHVMIPWIGGLVDNPGYVAPVPSKIECRSLLQHARLRGADGYYTWSNGANTNYIDRADFRDDMFQNAWQPLSWFFNRPGKNDILNLTTNKTGGVEWSGMRRGNRCMFVFSNYTTSAQQVDLPDTIENIPDLSPSIASGEHLVMDYVIGPLSNWKLDENANSIVGDEMAANHTGTVVKATWGSGKSGSALTFNGINASVNFDDVLDMGTSDRSISLWFKTTQTGTDKCLLSKGYSATSNQHAIYLYNGKLNCLMNISSNYRIVNSGVTVNDGNWHHATVTIQRNDKMKLYLDGEFKDEVDISADATIDVQNSYNFSLGRSYKKQYFEGSIDEVKIFSGVLSEQEILDEYACTLNLRFDERQGSNVLDDAIYENDGAVSGAAWVNGKFGSALSFDGNDYVAIPDSNTLDSADEITIALWIYPTAYNSGYAAHLAEKRDGTPGANFDMYFFGATAGSYYKKIRIYAEAGGTWKSVSPLYEVTTLNKWYHIAWTYSSTTGGKLYVDGVDQGSAVGSGSLSINTEALNLGSGFTGKMDEFKVYDKVLDADEISRLIP